MKCERCAEKIKPDALVCKHCGADRTSQVSKRRKSRAWLWLVLFVVLGLPILYASITDDGEPAAATPEQVAQAAEAKRKGLHCVDEFTGKHYALENAIKASLRDPKSYEYVETRIAPVQNGEHGLAMTYRARNGFGGMNVSRVAAVVDHETCDITKWTVLE